MKYVLVLCLFVLPLIVQAEANHPCAKIKDACEKAGFAKGGHKDGKGLFKDCMGPVMKGGSVAGVTVSPEDIKECQAKKEERHGHHGHHEDHK